MSSGAEGNVTSGDLGAMLCRGMKPGLVYALALVVLVLTVVILFQQRKLAETRNENAALRNDARALTTTRNAEAAASMDVQRELRQARSENEQLRKELQQFRDQPPRHTD